MKLINLQLICLLSIAILCACVNAAGPDSNRKRVASEMADMRKRQRMEESSSALLQSSEGRESMDSLNLLKVIMELEKSFDPATSIHFLAMLKKISYSRYSKFFDSLADITLGHVSSFSIDEVASVLNILKVHGREPKLKLLFKGFQTELAQSPGLIHNAGARCLVNLVNALTTMNSEDVSVMSNKIELHQIVHALAARLELVAGNLDAVGMVIALNSLSKAHQTGQVKATIARLSKELASNPRNLDQLKPHLISMCLGSLITKCDLTMEPVQDLLMRICRLLQRFDIASIASDQTIRILNSLAKLSDRDEIKKTMIVISRQLHLPSIDLKDGSSVPLFLNALSKLVSYKEMTDIMTRVAEMIDTVVARTFDSQGISLSLHALSKISYRKSAALAMLSVAKQIFSHAESFDPQGISNSICALSKICNSHMIVDNEEYKGLVVDAMDCLAEEAAWSWNKMSNEQLSLVLNAVIRGKVGNQDIIHRIVAAFSGRVKSMNAVDLTFTLNSLSKIPGYETRTLLNTMAGEIGRISGELSGRLVAILLNALSKCYWTDTVKSSMALLTNNFVLEKIDDMDSGDVVNVFYSISRLPESPSNLNLLKFLVSSKINYKVLNVGQLEALLTSMLWMKRAFGDEIVILLQVLAKRSNDLGQNGRSLVSIFYTCYRELVAEESPLKAEFQTILQVLVKAFRLNHRYVNLDGISDRKLANICLFERRSPILGSEESLFILQFCKSHTAPEHNHAAFSHIHMSRLQKEILDVAKSLDFSLESEVICPETGYSLDIGNVERKLAIEVNGPSHFLSDGKTADSNTVFKKRLLELYGWRLLTIPYFTWSSNSRDANKQLIKSFLSVVGAEDAAETFLANVLGGDTSSRSRKRVKIVRSHQFSHVQDILRNL